MPKYLVAASYAPQGAAGILATGGSARRAAVERAVAQFGGTLETFYFSFGSDDAIMIVDLPHAEAMAAVSLVVKATGTIHTRATVLLTAEQIDEAVRLHATFQAPGS